MLELLQSPPTIPCQLPYHTSPDPEASPKPSKPLRPLRITIYTKCFDTKLYSACMELPQSHQLDTPPLYPSWVENTVRQRHIYYISPTKHHSLTSPILNVLWTLMAAFSRAKITQHSLFLKGGEGLNIPGHWLETLLQWETKQPLEYRVVWSVSAVCPGDPLAEQALSRTALGPAPQESTA